MEIQSQDKFVQLIQEHEKIIHKIIGLYINEEVDRKDMFQEIMVQSWKSYSKFKGHSTFGTWLYKVSLNTVLNYHKKRKQSAFVSLDDEYPSVERKGKSELLYLLIKRLGSIDKMIITLHLDGYKNPEISEITGMTLNHINVKLHRIKNRIIESFKKYENGPL